MSKVKGRSKTEKALQPLSFSDQLVVTRVKPGELEATPAPEVSTEPGKFDSKRISDTHVPAAYEPKLIRINENLSLPTGIFIAPESKGVGKSVFTLALVAWVNGATEYPAQYFPCFEPRAPTYPAKASKVTSGEKRARTVVSSLSEVHIPFSDPTEFWMDAMSVLKTADPCGLVVFDSATDPLKAIDSEKWRGQPTFTGGMQPSDRDFLNVGALLAKRLNLCIILTINSQLISYASSLAGATEGMLTVKGPNRAIREDRSKQSKRKGTEIIIPDIYVDQATRALGLGAFNKTTSNYSRRGVIGINKT